QQVLLAPGEFGDSPEGLGLLAHELTHIGQAREPSAAIGGSEPGSRADEALARTVEARVIAAAQQARDLAGPFPESGAPAPADARAQSSQPRADGLAAQQPPF